MSLLKQNISRRRQVNTLQESELEAGNGKKYKVEAIRDSSVYTTEVVEDQPSGLYYLVI